MSNIITVDLSEGTTVVAPSLWQYDYGQYLVFEGVELPEYYQVHFSISQFGGKATTNLGTPDQGVAIPNDLLRVGTSIYAWVYLHTGEDDGETEYRITIPVTERSEPVTPDPTPQEEYIINQAIAALNAAVEQTALDVIDAGQSASDASGYAERAETAAEAAETAQGLAEDAQRKAEDAENSAASAKSGAESAASLANDYALAAESYAESADASADRAEQAAASKGYIYFYMEEGIIYADITDNVDVDFYMEDGFLYVTEVNNNG